jgi:two-component system response regulator MprA
VTQDVGTGTGRRLLVVDDDQAVTSLLRRGFSYEGYRVRTAASGEEALRIAGEQPPDLVVLDLMMPGLDGIEVCRRLRSAEPDLPILILTGRDHPSEEVAGLDAGADDYVTKPFTFDVLNARIRTLLRRRQATSAGGNGASAEAEPPPSLRYLDLSMDVPGRVAYRGERRVDLTSTEFNLLQLLMQHAQQVLSKEQILERVWGYDFGGDANIVEVYVRSLRVKLEAGGEPRLIQTVRGAGYVLREA